MLRKPPILYRVLLVNYAIKEVKYSIGDTAGGGSWAFLEQATTANGIF